MLASSSPSFLNNDVDDCNTQQNERTNERTESPRLVPFEFPPDVMVGVRVKIMCSISQGIHYFSNNWVYFLTWSFQSSSTWSISFPETTTTTQFNFSGDPPFTFKWFWENGPFTEVRNSSDKGLKVETSQDYAILSIENVQVSQAGNYTCSVSNEGDEQSYTSTLRVNGKGEDDTELCHDDNWSSEGMIPNDRANHPPKLYSNLLFTPLFLFQILALFFPTIRTSCALPLLLSSY